MIGRPAAALVCWLLAWPGTAPAAGSEPPELAAKVAAGALPALALRLPQPPAVVGLDGAGQAPGRHGGTLRLLMSQPKDTRMLMVYGYARLVGYDPDWNLVPDILERIDVEADRVFTLHLRRGHRWSDGQPFTAEDFRFYWQNVANDPTLSPGGPEQALLAEGRPPQFTVLDETTVRYAWDAPNPFFLPALAGARPQELYLPAHYLKRFHTRYADPAQLDKAVAAEGQRNWAALFAKRNHGYQNDNPELPSLQPWVLATPPPSSRFVFTRNPYYHRIDAAGRQLPYLDQVAITLASAALIPAKTAAGEADLQARHLAFENYTVLKQGEGRSGYDVRLWRSARGTELALYPNLTVADPVWRTLLQDVRFRRALSLAIDRHEINEVLFYGLARPGNDTVLPESPLYRPEYDTSWARFDLAGAAALLDQIGLTARNPAGIRLLPDGRPAEIVVETAGEDPLQVAVLELIRDSWAKAGIRLLIKTEQRDVLRNRVFAGLAMMSVWYGIENGLATAETAPSELAPLSQQQLCWPKWGKFAETGGRSGEPPTLPEAVELVRLHQAWLHAPAGQERAAIWQRMLAIRADAVVSIGTIRGVPQPVVVSRRLRNVPQQGIYNWEPGAFFGIYRPDTFWFAADGAAPTR